MVIGGRCSWWWWALAVALMASPGGAAPRVAATEPPAPGPMSHVRTGHPRLFFTSESLPLLRRRWADPDFAPLRRDVEKALADRGTAGAVANGLCYLATGDPACARAALAAAHSRPGLASCWMEPEALVFDWCYDALAPDERRTLLESLERKLPEAEAQAVAHFRFHESFANGCWPYPSICLAIDGEPGVDSHLPQCHNWMVHYREAEDETMGDGGARDGYPYQHFLQVALLMMWSLGTDRDLVGESGYARGLTEYFARRLFRDGLRVTAAPEDHAVDGVGCQYQSPLRAWSLFYLAGRFDDPVAQWLGDRVRAQSGFGGMDAGWLAFLFYDKGRPAASPGGLALSKCYPLNGMVNLRSGWHFAPDPEQDVVAWLYCGPKAEHCRASRLHFEIWRGDDALATIGGTYLGSPAEYQAYYNASIARNTLLFTPVGAAKPDAEAGEDPDDPALSRERYPISAIYGWYPWNSYRGEISDFQEMPGCTIATADASAPFARKMRWVKRDLVYIRPGVFIINDRFEAAVSLASVRWLLHTRRKPLLPGTPEVLRGSAAAGILEAPVAPFAAECGSSRLEVRQLWPGAGRLRAVGGEGREHWMDGRNYDPRQTCQTWLKTHPDLPRRMTWTNGMWRVEAETTPAAAAGSIVTALTVCARGDAGPRPSFTCSPAPGGRKVAVTYGGKVYDVFCPNTRDGRASVAGASAGRESGKAGERGSGSTAGRARRVARHSPAKDADERRERRRTRMGSAWWLQVGG